MFDGLLLHPRTHKQLEAFIANTSHGLILTGPEGAGKRHVAKAVAAAVLGLDAHKLDKHPYYSLTDPSDSSITIDEIRALQRLLTLKTPSTAEGIKRVITIIDAGRMRQEAQNAFLKSLEEPPADTLIILTADASGDLLDTIFSRAQKIEVLPVSEPMAQAFFAENGVPAVELARNYALSQGQAGLLSSLLNRDETHGLKAAVDEAKQLLAKPAGERLLRSDELAKDKPAMILLIDALGRITHAALMSASKADNMTAVKRWKASLAAVQDAREAMKYNANTKLVLDNLFLSL